MIEVYEDNCVKIITTSFFGEIVVDGNLIGVHLVDIDTLAVCNQRVLNDGDVITWSAPLPKLRTLCGDIGWFLCYDYDFLGDDQWYVGTTTRTYCGPSFNIETIEVVENLSMREKFSAYWDNNSSYLVWYGANTGLRAYSIGKSEYGGVNLTLPNLERWAVKWDDTGENSSTPSGWSSTQNLYINQLHIRGGRYWDYVGCKDFMRDAETWTTIKHTHKGLMKLSFDTAPAIKLIDDEANKDTKFGMFSYLIDEE
jgi:hypothetical protein